MFAKVFAQIFDSSIADNWQVRHVFEDLLKLADINGVVDMTHEAIARRTNVPLDVVTKAIQDLEQPDPKSRSKAEEGRRIVHLDKHRNWGWVIVNYQQYRQIASEEQRRAKGTERVRRLRAKRRNAHVTQCNAAETLGDASNARQKQTERKRQKQTEKETESTEWTGTSRARRPRSFSEVVTFVFSKVAKGFDEKEVPKWAKNQNWNLPSQAILDRHSESSSVVEWLSHCLRFVRYNNSLGWKVDSWRAAVKSFDKAGTGISDVPQNWIPVIEDEAIAGDFGPPFGGEVPS